MIIGYDKNEVQKYLSILENSEFAFQLTGSRFFGNATEKSDWDFFVQNSSQVVDFLRSNNFALITSLHSDWEDYRTALEHQHCSGIFFSCDSDKSIHIQVVRNFEHKQIIQNKLKSFNCMTTNDKRMRSHYWRLAYHLLPDVTFNKPEKFTLNYMT